MTKSLIILLLLLFGATQASAQWIDDAKVETAIHKGIRATYNMQFTWANKEFAKVTRAYPKHPAGHFLSAMVDWWRILIYKESTKNDDAFIEKLDKVIELCDDRLDKNENDVAALFLKGGAMGFQGRLYAIRKDWVNTATAGKNALPIVYEAEKLAPGNADIRLGTGIYNYYAAVLPAKYSALKPLMFFLPDGNKARGVKYLEKAAKEGTYAKYEAQYFLLQTYYSFENKPLIALEYAQSLQKEFPRNPVFQRYIGRCYVKVGNWIDATKTFDDVVTKCDAKKTGYTQRMKREALYYKGYYALLKREYGKAVKHFVACDKLSRSIDKEEPSGFMVMANLRMGMAHDGLNQRNYAKKQYGKVLAMSDYSNSHAMAKKYKKKPFGK